MLKSIQKPISGIGFVLGAPKEPGGIWVSRVDLILNEEKAAASGFTPDDIERARSWRNSVRITATG
ncbi:MAG: hypothetical protein IBX50_12100 [Marinospirillum sp.]|uniref:hypothetical protein n=1 Tax=Marinospirillum sp. TaxID=2183934 RepID=UPI0019FA6E96|nr:hypothetical protein [Marinospirillum sp.]MBE0507438.1 hypothetical protein [Marinospirillum sp.]